MLVSLTVVPMLCSRFLKVGFSDWLVFRGFEFLMDKTTAGYRRSISLFLRHRFLMVILSLAALGAGGWMYFLIGKEFITDEDQGRFSLRMQLPLSYSVEKGDEIMDRVLEELRAIPEVQHAFSFSGTGGFAFVTLVPKSERERSQLAIQSEVRNRVRLIPDIRASVTSTSPLGGRSRNEPVQFVLQGPSVEEIDRYSKVIMDRLETLPGYVGINRDLEIGKPELRLIIDREKAADAGIQTRDIASAVGALIGGTDVAEFKEGGKSYDIWLRLDREERELPSDMERMWIRTSNGTL
nr:efflux RND transporter permease subunit [bacterium]